MPEAPLFKKLSVLIAAYNEQDTLRACVEKQKALKPWQLRLYNLATPLLKILDKVLPISGLSTVAVCRKGDS